MAPFDKLRVVSKVEPLRTVSSTLHFVLPRTECARHEVRLSVEGRLRPEGSRSSRVLRLECKNLSCSGIAPRFYPARRPSGRLAGEYPNNSHSVKSGSGGRIEVLKQADIYL
jgi:hypothetical protein